MPCNVCHHRITWLDASRLLSSDHYPAQCVVSVWKDSSERLPEAVENVLRKRKDVMDYNENNCMAAIQFNGRLAKIVATELRLVNEPHQNMLRHAAGYLYLNGFLDMTCLVANGHIAKRERRQFITERRSAAVDSLRAAGIIPVAPAWLSVAWFVFKWVILPFLQNLLERYSDVEET